MGWRCQGGLRRRRRILLRAARLWHRCGRGLRRFQRGRLLRCQAARGDIRDHLLRGSGLACGNRRHAGQCSGRPRPGGRCRYGRSRFGRQPYRLRSWNIGSLADGRRGHLRNIRLRRRSVRHLRFATGQRRQHIGETCKPLHRRQRRCGRGRKPGGLDRHGRIHRCTPASPKHPSADRIDGPAGTWLDRATSTPVAADPGSVPACGSARWLAATRSAARHNLPGDRCRQAKPRRRLQPGPIEFTGWIHR